MTHPHGCRCLDTAPIECKLPGCIVAKPHTHQLLDRTDPAPPAVPPTLDPERPEIVCLCGSTRFYDEFQQANYDLTMAGKIVLSVGFYPHAKAKHGHGEGVGHDSSEKVALDELHKRKIDLADRVLVLNVGGYVGESTRSEIDYALAHGKPVEYLMELCHDRDCMDQGHFSGRDIHWKRTESRLSQPSPSTAGGPTAPPTVGDNE